MAFLSTNPAVSDAERVNQETGRAPMQQAAKAYSNYRQFSRDNYANQLANRSSLYQGMMNRLASAYGQQGSPNLTQMSNNPMSLRQTTVGSAGGSNAAGTGEGGATNQYGQGKGYNDWGLIGQMGALNPTDNAALRTARPSAGVNAPATLMNNGQPIPPGGRINNINTQSTWAPQTVAQSGAPQGFSFAPRRP